MKPVEEPLSSKLIYDGQITRLRVDTVRMPSGREATREVIEHSDCVAIVAVDADDNVLLVRQYRHAVGKELLEVPAGGIDAGEGPAEAVSREMQEETGYRPGKIERLGGFYSAPGFCTEYLHLYLARDLTSSQLYAEDTEIIRLERVPINEITDLITSGQIEDAKSIAGLLTYLEHRKSTRSIK
ncbi:MAG: NUDIX hydrolase [Dehalococcoidales bacterium]